MASKTLLLTEYVELLMPGGQISIWPSNVCRLVSSKVSNIWIALTIADSFFSLWKILDSSCSMISRFSRLASRGSGSELFCTCNIWSLLKRIISQSDCDAFECLSSSWDGCTISTSRWIILSSFSQFNTSCLGCGGSMQVSSLSSKSMIAEVPMCLITRSTKSCFFFKKSTI